MVYRQLEPFLLAPTGNTALGFAERECTRPETLPGLADARWIGTHYVTEYNVVRLHSGIGYITPQDRLLDAHRPSKLSGNENSLKLVWLARRRTTTRSSRRSASSSLNRTGGHAGRPGTILTALGKIPFHGEPIHNKFYDWRRRYGQPNEHNAALPRGIWLQAWEKQAILDYRQDHRDEGYRRLTFMRSTVFL
jgi:hypothetical protein